MFEKTLSPIKLGPHNLKNRIVFGAHTNNMASGGEPNARQIEYLRARNDAGMVVVEPLPVHQSTIFARGNIDRIRMERSDERLRDVATAIKENGAVGILQLIHLGQHGDGEVSFQPNLSPSGLPSFIGSTGSHEVSGDNIEDIIEGFVKSAMLAKRVGFDGVDLFANYQGLIEQFWTPWFNRRTDRWGGDLSGRTRFSTEILQRIKVACGLDFIVGLSISYLDMPGITLSLDDLAEIVVQHDADALIDYVSCGTGGYLDTGQLVPAANRGHSLGSPLAALLKSKSLRALVQVESGFRDPDHIEDALLSEKSDLVSLVRAQIAEPDYVRKLKSGTPEKIRPCLGCNQKCIGRRARDKWISCVVNPSTGREWMVKSSIKPSTRATKKVVVVGAGPGGLTAAAQLGQAGNEVHLFEREKSLGGLIALFGQSESNTRWRRFAQWLESEAQSSDCKIETEAEQTFDNLSNLDADAIIWAVGAPRNQSLIQRSALRVPPIVVSETAMDIATALARPERLGKKILFVDDHHGFAGLPNALHVSELGHDVTIVSGKSMIGQDLMVLGTLGPLRKALFNTNGHEIVDTALLTWNAGRAVLLNLVTGQETEAMFDTLIWANVPISTDHTFMQPDGLGPEFHILGDAYAPRDAASAIHDAYELANTLCR